MNTTTTWSSAVLVALTLGACSGAPTPAAVPKVDLPSGTAITVRLSQALSTDRNKSGDTFTAVLDSPIVAGGTDIIPKGTSFTGHVTTADTSGRLEGRGVLGITLDAFDWNGQTYPIVTSLDTRTTEAHKKSNIELIGGGAGIGALIGGLADGGKGAGIGAIAGAAGGTGVAAATGKKNVDVAAETVFQFSLTSPIQVQP